MTTAYKVLQDIRNLYAFTITNGKRRRVNQNCTSYTFADQSVLKLYRDGRGQSFTSDGICDCVSTIRANVIA